MTAEKTARIRALNDGLRRTFQGGKVLCTPGISNLPTMAVAEVYNMVRAFDAFTTDNDPYHEHDFGSLEVCGERIFFKIDCYQTGSDYLEGAADPSDAATTDRVMTIMLAEEY